MIKRPSKNETEEDILQMQKEFLEQKGKLNFQPAAQSIRVEKDIGLVQKNPKEGSGKSVRNSKIVIGDIVEKQKDSNLDTFSARSNEHGFPKASRIKRTPQAKTPGKSLFALSKSKQKQSTEEDTPEIENLKVCDSGEPSTKFGDKSYILLNDESNQIHSDNVKYLSNLNENDILQERQQLLRTLDPSLINFFKSKRQKTQPSESNLATISETKLPEIDSVKSDFQLPDAQLQEWHNYNLDVKIETDKLEWIKDIPNKLHSFKPGESYEARFDWKGVLLPYIDELTDENRHLYLHEIDVHRPGYTLQELFRLARSNMIQQRNAAIFSIAGILNIYNQGFYDGILELPISKIYFLLRFALDDNTQSLLETSSKALATLIYNDSDEALLDFIYECSPNYMEPILGFRKESNAKKNDSKSYAYNANVADDEEDIANLNDFHLAETDLIQCILRSNIIQRIYYVLTTIKPDNSTVLNCFKILIRLARTDKSVAETIMNHESFLQSLCKEFLPIQTIPTTNEFYGKSQFLLLKLLRIIGSYGIGLCERLNDVQINEIIKSCIFIREEVNIQIIRLQIEAFRLVKVLTIIRGNYDLHKEITPALLHMLEWSYQFLSFDQGSPIFRQHATSILGLLDLTNINNDESLYRMMLTKLNLCFSKWFYLATNSNIEEVSRNILLSMCLRLSIRFNEYFKDFFEKYLLPFVNSNLSSLLSNLRKESTLLSAKTHRKDPHQSLPNIESIVFQNNSPKFILSEKYPIFLLNSILMLNDKNIPNPFKDIFFHNEHLLNYINDIAKRSHFKFRDNWFTRIEILFLLNLLKSKEHRLDKSTLQTLCHRLMYCLIGHEITYVLDVYKIIFDVSQYERTNNFTQIDLDQWKTLYVKMCVIPNIRKSSQNIGLLLPNYRNVLFSYDWFYSPLLALMNPDEYKQYFAFQGITEKDLIMTTLSFAMLCKLNLKNLISPTDELIFLMCPFMGTDASFLVHDIKSFLSEVIQNFFHENTKTIFEFDRNIEGTIKFETFYISFLEQFQATSYGDDTFSSLVMVPLSMKYDIKWRNMVWGEHASVLRFINCSEDQLIESLETYLYPIENDLNLLKCYAQTLNSNMLMENSIPYKIAKHHVDYFKANKK